MSADAPAYVLDSFALLVYLQGEAGMPRVKAVLEAAAQGSARVYLSLINLGELLYITEREQGLTQAQAVLAAVEQLPIQVLPATREAVLQAAHLKARYPLAYADAFAVAAALAQEGLLLTGDPEFAAIEALIRVEWL